jgi:hypothetical protein
VISLRERPNRVGRPHLVFPAAGEPQDLPCQLGSAHDRFFDIFQVGHVAVVGLLVEHDQGDVSLNAHQQVVEIMGDAPGQGADGLHLLGLPGLG